MTTTTPIIRMNIGGAPEEFRGEEVISASMVLQVNPLSAELIASEVEFTIFSTDPKYSIFSDGTYFSALSKRQPVLIYEQVGTAEIFLGRFFLEDWKAENENQFWFKGYDLIGSLDYVKFDGRFWSSDTTFAEVVAIILENLGIDYVILDGVGTTPLRGWLPPSTVREALQQACFAAGAMILSSRDQLEIGASRFVVDLPAASFLVDDARKKNQEELELLPLVTKISLISHEYSQGTDLVTIFDQTLAPGNYKIVFEEPYYDVSATGAGATVEDITTEDGVSLTTEDGVTLVIEQEFVFGPNYVYLSVESQGGAVLIQGYPWVDSQQVHLYDAALGENVKENQLEIKDATLISPSNAQDILDHLVDYYSQRYRQKITLLELQFPTRYYGDPPVYGDGLYEGPGDAAINVGEILESSTFKSKSILGVIEKLEIDLTGGFLIDIENIGVED